MKLSELAFACYVYGRMSDFDGSYAHLLKAIHPELDFHSGDHLTALLQWLNAWGCRQFAKKYHPDAIGSIRKWYDTIGCELADEDLNILTMTKQQMRLVAEAFGALSAARASLRERSGGNLLSIDVGPTGASKILFAWKPNAALPWDGAMRAFYEFDGTAASYATFLAQAQQELEGLAPQCAAAGFAIADLPSMIGKKGSSLMKLLDEYHWVTLTRECPAPGAEELRRWYAWS